MKPNYRTALMVIAFAFILPLSAHAEIRPGSTELGVFGGYNMFEDSQNLESGPILGGRVGYNFTSHFGLEVAVERIWSQVDDNTLTGAQEGQFRSPTNDVDLTFYHIDAVYHLIPEGKFNPFVLVGIGGAHYSPQISDGDMPVLNVGLGAKYWVTENIALRADLKDSIVTEVFQENYHNLGATLGITVAFGGETKPVPARAEKVVEKPVVVVVAEPEAEEKVAVIAAAPVVATKVVVLAFEDIHFDFDKATLTPQAQEMLKKNLEVLQKNPRAKIRIAGYTSASGTEEYNQELSEKRATAVKNFLVERAVVAPARLKKIGYGETDPETYEAAPKDLYSKAAKSNMRVLFEIILKD